VPFIMFVAKQFLGRKITGIHAVQKLNYIVMI